jgi:hypothetical protein
MVCARPIRILRDMKGLLHSDTHKAIEYSDGWGLHMLHGVRFSEELWTRIISRQMPFADILKIEDVDQRRQAMKYGDRQEFLKYAKAELLDTHDKTRPDGTHIPHKLWKIPQGDIFTKDAYYAEYESLSVQGEFYFQGVMPSKTVAEAMGWKRGITAQEWLEQKPMVHES